MAPVLTFLFPAVLVAAGAVLVPVLIHLLLREHPRTVVFPALRFVRKSHRVSISRLRLRQLLLLALRMAAVAAVALLIAKPMLSNWRLERTAGLPAAMAVVIDNSASMDYFKGQATSLARAKQEALRIVAQLPAGSLVCVLQSGGGESAVGLLTDTKQAQQQIACVTQGGGAYVLGPSVAKALAVVRQSDLPRKEVLIVSDLAKHALVGGLASGGDDAGITVIDVSPGDDVSISLGEPSLSARALPLGAPLRVDAPVLCRRIGGELTLTAQIEDSSQRQALSMREAGMAAASFTLTASRSGPCHGTIRLTGDDPLGADNVRYFTANVVDRPRVLLVRGADARQDVTSFLIGSAIAPGGADGPATRRTIPADRLDAKELSACDILLLANVPAPTPDQWRLIEQFVRGGGSLWVLAGSAVDAQAYASSPAAAVMPATLGSPQSLGTPMGFADGKLDNALLAPFAEANNPPLSEARAYWRFGSAAPLEGAQTLLAYSDALPAVVRRRVGLGTSLLWNISPAPECSNLASRPQGVILAMRSAALLSGEPISQTDWPLGQTVDVPLPSRMRAPRVTLLRPGQSEGMALLPDLPSRSVRVPCDAVGHWTVIFREGPAEQAVGWSVNLPITESDLAICEQPELLAMLGQGASVVHSASEFAQNPVRVARGLDLSVPLLLGLLALLVAESFLANRFYSREPDATSDSL